MRRVVRQQNQKNLRANADPDTKEASQEFNRDKEKRSRGKIADPKAIAYSGEIPFTLLEEEKESGRESHPNGETRAERIRFTEEEKEILSHADSRFFTQRFSEEETQVFVANSDTGGIPGAFAGSDGDTWSGRNAQCHAVTFAQEKRSTGYDRGQRHIRLRKLPGHRAADRRYRA